MLFISTGQIDVLVCVFLAELTLTSDEEDGFVNSCLKAGKHRELYIRY